MNPFELEGVVAHELSHIRHYDIAVSIAGLCWSGGITGSGIENSVVERRQDVKKQHRNGHNNPLAIVGFILIIVAPIIATLQRSLSST